MCWGARQGRRKLVVVEKRLRGPRPLAHLQDASLKRVGIVRVDGEVEGPRAGHAEQVSCCGSPFFSLAHGTLAIGSGCHQVVRQDRNPTRSTRLELPLPDSCMLARHLQPRASYAKQTLCNIIAGIKALPRHSWRLEVEQVSRSSPPTFTRPSETWL